MPRYIVFIDDEKNMLKLQSIVDKDLLPASEMEALLRNVVLNINVYIAKYDFDIANKISECHAVKRAEAIRLFNTNCIIELLHDCSRLLTKNKKTYMSLWMLNGT